MTDYLVRADTFLARLVAWAEARQDVRALMVVGSFARGQARDDSDLDVILLASHPAALVHDTTWIHDLGDVSRITLETYGRVISIRAHFDDGLEAEISVAATDWAAHPFDAGSLRVAHGGMRVLFDRDGAARQLADEVGLSTR